MIKQLLNGLTVRYDEHYMLMRMLSLTGLKKDTRILDVGCGYGEKMDWLVSAGFSPEGVDIHQAHVDSNKERGLSCQTVGEFQATQSSYDMMLMSHIIEHFTPNDLLQFIDSYLERLELGGYLIIITPLMWHRFYDDFDHVRPYPPESIRRVFCGNKFQMQYHSRHRLEECHIMVRRRRFIPQHYHRTPGAKLRTRVVSRIASLSYRLSAGMIGVTDGWMGLFRRIG